jgi:hypothetical protein
VPALARAMANASADSLRGAMRLGMDNNSGLGVGPGDSSGTLQPGTPAASLYAPRPKTETSGSLEHVPGAIRPGGPMLSTTERGAPTASGGAKVPYYEVMPGYSRAAEDALAGEEVPPAYRPTVRKYFDALEAPKAPRAEKKSPPAG